MAAEAKLIIRAKLRDLGIPMDMVEQFTLVPTKAHYRYMTQTTEDTAEALDVGDITTIQCIIVKAQANDLTIDTSYSASFTAELIVVEGQWQIFTPSGTVYIKNQDAAELCTFEYIILGT